MICRGFWPVTIALQSKPDYFAEPGFVGNGKLITAIKAIAQNEIMTTFF